MPSKRKVLGDFYYKKSKREGYRSRSALKLKEIGQHFQIFCRGYRVVDLGAAPGGWLQVEREFVDNEGLVIGVDMSPIRSLPYDNVKLIQGDVTSPAIIDEIARLAGGGVDVIASDLAPNFTGVHDLDHGRQIDLANMAVESAHKLLKVQGSMVIKVLMGSEFKTFMSRVQKEFLKVRIFKPAASRDSSSEVYLVCLGFVKAEGHRISNP